MAAIYKKELKSYFTSMIGYIFIAFLVFVTGIYFTGYVLAWGYPVFNDVLSAVTFVFLILVPILTMRIMADEKRQKTDQLLYTAPVRIIDVVLGKYFALLTILAIPMLLFCFYPIIMSFYGEAAVSYPLNYTGIFGFFMLGASYLAAGLFISALSESQVIAAVVTFAALLISYFISGLTAFLPGTVFSSYIGFAVIFLLCAILLYLMTKSIWLSAAFGILAEAIAGILYLVKPSVYEGALAKVLNMIDCSARLDNFIHGIFDLTGIVYYLSFIGFFIYLTVQAVQKRRWS